jgi:ABC-type branched-subunit amino acid transport system substrate-binding protein
MVHRSRFGWLIVAVLALAAFAFACSDDNGDTPGDGTPSDDPTSEATVDDASPTPFSGEILTKDEILAKTGDTTETAVLKIGWMFEETGPPQVTGFGVPTGDGVRLAVKEINDAGGFQVGDTVYTIELVEYDTRSDVSNTIAVTQQLIQDDGVKVIFGPATLGETEASAVTQPNEILHLCPCQQREQNALSSVEKAQGDSKWAFQTLLPFSLLVNQGARNFDEEWPDFRTMALICQNSETGRDICDRTRDAYAAEGVEIIGEIQYFPVGTTDFTPFLTSLSSQGEIDYLYNYDNPENTPTIVRRALELGIGKLHLVTVPATLAQPLIGREIPADVTISAGAAPRQGVQPTSEKATQFFERYAAFVGGANNLPIANFVSLMTYDYVFMVTAAMQQAESVDDTTAIAEKLAELHYDGVAEDDLFFNPRHLAVHGTEPCYVRDDPAQSDPSKVTIECLHQAPPPEAAR